jgi:hypothetical protein
MRGTRSYLVSGCEIEAAKKDYDLYDVRWQSQVGLEEFYPESLHIQQIALVPPSKYGSVSYMRPRK